MARSAEKAATELSRWYKYKLDKEGHTQLKSRPYLATECYNLKDAIIWRREVVQEISTNVCTIQNAQLGEFRLRDLNDHINKLIREKQHWEDRIKELGGADYKKSAPKMLTRDGKEVPGNRGYRYFGAARDLPGVRELFDIKIPQDNPKNRVELMKYVDADYFGYRDEDDGIIIALEKDAEDRARKIAIDKWRTNLIQNSNFDEFHRQNIDGSYTKLTGKKSKSLNENKENEEEYEIIQPKLMLEYREIQTGDD